MKRLLTSGRCDECGLCHERHVVVLNSGFTVLSEHKDIARVRCGHCGYRFSSERNNMRFSDELFNRISALLK